jgi:hypothetical protein
MMQCLSALDASGVIKKADAAEHPEAFSHVGLLVNGPPGTAGLPFNQSSDDIGFIVSLNPLNQLYDVPVGKQARVRPLRYHQWCPRASVAG